MTGLLLTLSCVRMLQVENSCFTGTGNEHSCRNMELLNYS